MSHPLSFAVYWLKSLLSFQKVPELYLNPETDFVAPPSCVSSVLLLLLTEYWREGSTSTAISTIFASDVVSQHNKIGGINFGTALVFTTKREEITAGWWLLRDDNPRHFYC